MDAEEKLIRLCCAQIEKELNWGNVDHWSTQDFENLSERIADKARIRLSVSTLKRVWGKVQYDSLHRSAH